MRREKKSVAQKEAAMERQGQTVLPTMPSHSLRGGARAGAGRPVIAVGGQAKTHSLWCTDAEFARIKDFLHDLRQNGF